jgi:hypothetical protein
MPRRARVRGALPLSFPLILAACGGPATDAPLDATASPSAATSSRVGDGLPTESLERTVEILHEKMTALASAMPEESLGWRPMEGVRSVEEVYIHVAADNWWVPAMMGWEAPPETGVTADSETFSRYQERTMSRDEMLEALDASFVFLREAIEDSRQDLDRPVSLRGTPTTVGDIWIRAAVHLHEHLGQSIAYARSNRVVPPWSR